MIGRSKHGPVPPDKPGHESIGVASAEQKPATGPENTKCGRKMRRRIVHVLNAIETDNIVEGLRAQIVHLQRISLRVNRPHTPDVLPMEKAGLDAGYREAGIPGGGKIMPRAGTDLQERSRPQTPFEFQKLLIIRRFSQILLDAIAELAPIIKVVFICLGSAGLDQLQEGSTGRTPCEAAAIANEGKTERG